MNQNWQILPSSVAQVVAFVEQHKDSPRVKQRIERNLRDNKPTIDKDQFWLQMTICMLSSQQKSGPTSPIVRFIRTRPFPFDYATCLAHKDNLIEFGKKTLTDFGGIRFTNNIPTYLAKNLKRLEEEFWPKTLDALENLRLHQDQPTERGTARFLARRLKGLGPKQSRNVLQCLGLTRYEIPINSRVTNRLNELGFVVQYSLDNTGHYCRVMGDIQKLCKACGLLPCVLDAAMFASFDEGGWTEENVKDVF